MKEQLMQVADLWKEIQSSADTQKNRLKMAQMARLLLEMAGPDEAELTELSGSEELTDFFIEYLDLGELLQAFFQASLPHLETELKDGEFESQLQKTETEIQAVVSQYQNLKENHKKILEKQETLARESEQLESLKSRLAELKRLEAELDAENLAAIKEEIQSISQKTEAQKPKLDQLKQEREQQAGALAAMEELMAELTEKQERSQERILAVSERLSQVLDQEWLNADEQKTRTLRLLKQRNAAFEKITAELEGHLRELEAITQAQARNQSLLQRHFAANARAAEGAEKLPLHQPSLERIQTLSASLESQLAEFDQILAELIQTQEAIQNNIRKRNKSQ